eukprot:gb/GECG01010402.1/.p1 GENE.gb/GECG01010402.1/~~gb/GECG01010402.1/.p1  ORF type:complete len:111 (+),score=7.76 gb/GECG01010402.1/:1-333(+)
MGLPTSNSTDKHHSPLLAFQASHFAFPSKSNIPGLQKSKHIIEVQDTESVFSSIRHTHPHTQDLPARIAVAYGSLFVEAIGFQFLVIGHCLAGLKVPNTLSDLIEALFQI